MNCTPVFKKVVKAGQTLNMLDESGINRVLKQLAEKTLLSCDYIIAENKKDLCLMPESDPRYDRLLLTRQRIESIASDIRMVSELPYPIGRILSDKTQKNGLKIKRITVPFGVIGIIYEARPNVTFDVFSLCFTKPNSSVNFISPLENIALVKELEKELMHNVTFKIKWLDFKVRQDKSYYSAEFIAMQQKLLNDFRQKSARLYDEYKLPKDSKTRYLDNIKSLDKEFSKDEVYFQK